MAITAGNTSHATPAETTSGGAAPVALTWSHTCESGTTKLVVTAVGVVSSASGSNRDISGITFNSVALTKITERDDGGFFNAEIWRLDNPDITTANIVVTYVGNSNANDTYRGGGAISLIGAAAESEGTPATAAGTTADPSVNVDSVSGDYCIGCYNSDIGGAGASTPNGTQIWKDENFASDVDFGANYVVASGATTAVTWTAAAGFNWVLCAAAFKAAGATNATANPTSGTATAGVGTITPDPRPPPPYTLTRVTG